MTKNNYWLLFFIFLIGYLLRVWFLPSNILTFGYDQARDAFIAGQILNGDLKVFGPPSSTQGLFHGVFYYYVLAVGYLWGKNPINAAYFIALINSSTVLVVFYLAYLMTSKKMAAFMAAIMFMVSFEATQYATWLSNPTIAIFSVPLIYLGLWMWTQSRKKYGPIITALGFGISIQAELFLLYHLVPVLIWLWTSKSKIKLKDLSLFLMGTGMLTITMLVAQIKFGFGHTISGLFNLAISKQVSLAYADSLGDYLVLYLNQIGRIFAFNAYPGNIGIGGVLVIGALFFLIKSSSKEIKLAGFFLGTWIFSHFSVVSVGGNSTPFLMVGIGPGVSIVLGIFLSELWLNKNKILASLILLILIFGNLSMIMRENAKGSTLFSIQSEMLLSRQLAVIDYTYEVSNEKIFSINTVTSPLWINTVWSYLYNWHGQEQYGYLPKWHGRDQVGQLGNNLETSDEQVDSYFLIAEPAQGIPPQFYNDGFSEELARFGKPSEEKIFGQTIVQMRSL